MLVGVSHFIFLHWSDPFFILAPVRKYNLSLYTAKKANTCEDSVFACVGANKVFFTS